MKGKKKEKKNDPQKQRGKNDLWEWESDPSKMKGKVWYVIWSVYLFYHLIYGC